MYYLMQQWKDSMKFSCEQSKCEIYEDKHEKDGTQAWIYECI